MFKLWWNKILALFGKKQDNNDKQLEENDKFTIEYEDTRDINFTSIFSNKLSNYVINDSNIDLIGDDNRTELIKKVLKKLKKKLKKIVARDLGTGGILVIPYVTNNKIYYDIISQNRLCINKKIGDDIIDCTIMAEHIIKNKNNYYRWVDYTLDNGTLYIKYRATLDGDLVPLSTIAEWATIEDIAISNVEKMPFMFIKSPIDNRHENDDYGVPITYGCEKQIREIKDTLNQILREYDLKEAFVGADTTMFNGNDALPTNGLYKKINTGEDDFWEIFDPSIRDSSYYNKLMQQCAMLEKQIGTSRGIITDPLSTYQNTDETRRALYDTFSLVDDIRESLNDGLEDFIYACNVLANYYNLSPVGKYQLKIDWDYSFIEDSSSNFNQLLQGESRGVIKKEEVRQFIKPEESLEEAKKAIEEIRKESPTTKDLLGD